MATIDQYSVGAVPIEMLFNTTSLSIGTGFIWSHGAKNFLITNWHNVSGKDPNTGMHLSPSAAEPNRLKIWFNQKGQLGNKIPKLVEIRDPDNVPLWYIHPSHGSKIDVIALPLGIYTDVEMYSINTMPHDNLLIQIGMDVFILGFPFGMGPGGLPIWKRGSIASEPDVAALTQLHLFVDTASRPGMSGSPVIRRSWATHMFADNNVSLGTGTATKLVGVYSGRTATRDPLDAQLGFVWPASLLPEIVSGTKRDV